MAESSFAPITLPVKQSLAQFADTRIKNTPSIRIPGAGNWLGLGRSAGTTEEMIPVSKLLNSAALNRTDLAAQLHDFRGLLAQGQVNELMLRKAADAEFVEMVKRNARQPDATRDEKLVALAAKALLNAATQNSSTLEGLYSIDRDAVPLPAEVAQAIREQILTLERGVPVRHEFTVTSIAPTTQEVPLNGGNELETLVARLFTQPKDVAEKGTDLGVGRTPEQELDWTIDQAAGRQSELDLAEAAIEEMKRRLEDERLKADTRSSDRTGGSWSFGEIVKGVLNPIGFISKILEPVLPGFRGKLANVGTMATGYADALRSGVVGDVGGAIGGMAKAEGALGDLLEQKKKAGPSEIGKTALTIADLMRAARRLKQSDTMVDRAVKAVAKEGDVVANVIEAPPHKDIMLAEIPESVVSEEGVFSSAEEEQRALDQAFNMRPGEIPPAEGFGKGPIRHVDEMKPSPDAAMTLGVGVDSRTGIGTDLAAAVNGIIGNRQRCDTWAAVWKRLFGETQLRGWPAEIYWQYYRTPVLTNVWQSYGMLDAGKARELQQTRLVLVDLDAGKTAADVGANWYAEVVQILGHPRLMLDTFERMYADNVWDGMDAAGARRSLQAQYLVKPAGSLTNAQYLLVEPNPGPTGWSKPSYKEKQDCRGEDMNRKFETMHPKALRDEDERHFDWTVRGGGFVGAVWSFVGLHDVDGEWKAARMRIVHAGGDVPAQPVSGQSAVNGQYRIIEENPGPVKHAKRYEGASWPRKSAVGKVAWEHFAPAAIDVAEGGGNTNLYRSIMHQELGGAGLKQTLASHVAGFGSPYVNLSWMQDVGAGEVETVHAAARLQWETVNLIPYATFSVVPTEMAAQVAEAELKNQQSGLRWLPTDTLLRGFERATLNSLVDEPLKSGSMIQFYMRALANAFQFAPFEDYSNWWSNMLYPMGRWTLEQSALGVPRNAHRYEMVAAPAEVEAHGATQAYGGVNYPVINPLPLQGAAGATIVLFNSSVAAATAGFDINTLIIVPAWEGMKTYLGEFITACLSFPCVGTIQTVNVNGVNRTNGVTDWTHVLGVMRAISNLRIPGQGKGLAAAQYAFLCPTYYTAADLAAICIGFAPVFGNAFNQTAIACTQVTRQRATSERMFKMAKMLASYTKTGRDLHVAWDIVCSQAFVSPVNCDVSPAVLERMEDGAGNGTPLFWTAFNAMPATVLKSWSLMVPATTLPLSNLLMAGMGRGSSDETLPSLANQSLLRAAHLNFQDIALAWNASSLIYAVGPNNEMRGENVHRTIAYFEDGVDADVGAEMYVTPAAANADAFMECFCANVNALTEVGNFGVFDVPCMNRLDPTVAPAYTALGPPTQYFNVVNGRWWFSPLRLLATDKMQNPFQVPLDQEMFSVGDWQYTNVVLGGLPCLENTAESGGRDNYLDLDRIADHAWRMSLLGGLAALAAGVHLGTGGAVLTAADYGWVEPIDGRNVANGITLNWPFALGPGMYDANGTPPGETLVDQGVENLLLEAENMPSGMRAVPNIMLKSRYVVAQAATARVFKSGSFLGAHGATTPDVGSGVPVPKPGAPALPQ